MGYVVGLGSYKIKIRTKYTKKSQMLSLGCGTRILSLEGT